MCTKKKTIHHLRILSHSIDVIVTDRAVQTDIGTGVAVAAR